MLRPPCAGWTDWELAHIVRKFSTPARIILANDFCRTKPYGACINGPIATWWGLFLVGIDRRAVASKWPRSKKSCSRPRKSLLPNERSCKVSNYTDVFLSHPPAMMVQVGCRKTNRRHHQAQLPRTHTNTVLEGAAR